MDQDSGVITNPKFRMWLRPDGIVQLVWVPRTAITLEDAIAATGAMAQLVIAAADVAMYDAKRRGGGRCVLYSEDLHGRRGRRPQGEPLEGPSFPGDPGQGQS